MSPGSDPAASGRSIAPIHTARLVVMFATYNERDCIEGALRSVAGVVDTLRLAGVEMRVLLVDDESPDETAAVAVDVAQRCGLSLTVSSAPRAGLGRAYLRGFADIAAEGWADTIVTLDADGQHDPALIPVLVAERKRRSLDLLIGSRWVTGGRVVGLSWGRQVLSRIGGATFAIVTGTRGVADPTTSYRVFSPALVDMFKPEGLSVSGYSFFSSFVGVTSALGYRIGEHPIVFASRTAGASKLQPRDLVQFARNLPALRREVRGLRAEHRHPR